MLAGCGYEGGYYDPPADYGSDYRYYGYDYSGYGYRCGWFYDCDDDWDDRHPHRRAKKADDDGDEDDHMRRRRHASDTTKTRRSVDPDRHASDFPHRWEDRTGRDVDRSAVNRRGERGSPPLFWMPQRRDSRR
jgi:hypothetical protein